MLTSLQRHHNTSHRDARFRRSATHRRSCPRVVCTRKCTPVRVHLRPQQVRVFAHRNASLGSSRRPLNQCRLPTASSSSVVWYDRLPLRTRLARNQLAPCCTALEVEVDAQRQSVALRHFKTVSCCVIRTFSVLPRDHVSVRGYSLSFLFYACRIEAEQSGQQRPASTRTCKTACVHLIADVITQQAAIVAAWIDAVARPQVAARERQFAVGPGCSRGNPQVDDDLRLAGGDDVISYNIERDSDGR